MVFCFIICGCQYQCTQLPGKTRLLDDYCVSSGMLNATRSFTRLCLICLFSMLTTWGSVNSADT